MFSRTADRVTFFTQRCTLDDILLEYSYSSADIVFSMIKIFQKFEVFRGFVYLFIRHL